MAEAVVNPPTKIVCELRRWVESDRKTADMAPSAISPPKWDAGFNTLKREKLFRNPPTDRTVYPALAEAFEPHVDSFNAVFEKGGFLDKGIQDIGTKVFLDGDPNNLRRGPPRNRLHVRIREWFLDRAALPPSNKFSTTNREIYPAECRERHSSYKGRFRVRLEVKVNDGDWKEMIRDLGQVPIMLRVGFPRRTFRPMPMLTAPLSPTDVTWSHVRLHNLYSTRRSRKSLEVTLS